MTNQLEIDILFDIFIKDNAELFHEAAYNDIPNTRRIALVKYSKELIKYITENR